MMIYFLIGTIVCVTTCIIGIWTNSKGVAFTKEGMKCTIINLVVCSFLLWPIQVIWVSYITLPCFKSKYRDQLLAEICDGVIEKGE